jgi:DNA replication initiation complex subunit (GINS family)
VSSLLDLVKKRLELEQQTSDLLPLPEDFYQNIAKHFKMLRRSINNNNADITNNLILRQIEMLNIVSSRLLKLRLDKATDVGPAHLLPEEKSVFELKLKYTDSYRRLLESLADGKHSYLEYLRKRELGRKVVVRILKELGEIVGTDLRRYGPFKPGDVAFLPWPTARIMIAEGDATKINSTKNLDYE